MMLSRHYRRDIADKVDFSTEIAHDPLTTSFDETATKIAATDL